MDTSTLVNFLNSLVKTRDFLFACLFSIPTFLFESYDETLIEFLTAGDSSIIAGAIGMFISKLNELTIIQWRQKSKIVKLYNKLIKKLDSELQKENIKKGKKNHLLSLKRDSESTLELFDDKFIEVKSLKDRLKILIDRYEKI